MGANAFVYDFGGKCKWIFINGYYLVDPGAQTEFIEYKKGAA